MTAVISDVSLERRIILLNSDNKYLFVQSHISDDCFNQISLVIL